VEIIQGGKNLKPRGSIQTRTGKKVVHVAESVILITSTVPSGEVGTPGEIQVDHDVLNKETFINMVSEVLIMMHEHLGHDSVARVIAEYAQQMKLVEPGENGRGIIHLQAKGE
jgi:hypothetical protein